jgi:hypothetical protein
METIGYGLYFGIYDVAKRAYGVPHRHVHGQPLPSGVDGTGQGDAMAVLPRRMAAAATSGSLMWMVIYPLDVIRSHYMVSR